MNEFLLTVSDTLMANVKQAAIQGCIKLAELSRYHAPKRPGKFRYAYDYKTNKDVNEYNALRHYGSVWSIITTYRQMHMVKIHSLLSMPHVVDGCLNWAWDKFSVPSEQDGSKGALICKGDNYKLGGNALALLACSEFVRWQMSHPDQFNGYNVERFPQRIVQANLLATGILQNTYAGGFVHKVDIRTGEIDDFRSNYYEGEALFALAHWINTLKSNPSKFINNVDFDMLEAEDFIREYMPKLQAVQYGVSIQSHWMCYALAELLKYNTFQDIGFRPWLYDIAYDIIVNNNYRDKAQAANMACHTEALMAAYNGLGTSITDAQKLDVLTAVRENIEIMLQFIKPDGAIVKSLRSDIVQIDVIQHSISAFTAFYNAINQLKYQTKLSLN